MQFFLRVIAVFKVYDIYFFYIFEFCYVPINIMCYIQQREGLTSGGEGLRSKLVDGRCRVQFAVALVDLAVLSFPWFSPKLT